MELIGRKSRQKAGFGECGEVIRTLAQLNAVGKRWVPGKDLLETLTWPVTEAKRRRLRIIAQSNRDRILSSAKGYCLNANATREELHHASSWFRSQAAEMLKAAICYENYIHHGDAK